MLALALALSPGSHAPTYVPLLIASAGLLMDAWRVTDALTALVADGTAQVLSGRHPAATPSHDLP